MNLYAIGPLIVSFITLSFGILAYSRNRAAKLNRLFFALCISVFIWSFAYSRMYDTKNDFTLALFWARIGYIGVVFIPAFTYHYIITFLGFTRRKLTIYSVYLLAILFLIISRTDLFLHDGYNFFWGYYPKAGVFYIFFVLFFSMVFLRSVILLFFSLKFREANAQHIQVNRIKYVLFGFAIATTSIIDYIQNYGIAIYPWGYLSALGWLICMGWASFKYRLMDIKIVLTRAGIFVVVYTLVLGIPLYMGHNYHQWQHSTWTMGFLATIGPFIFMLLEKRSKELLYKIEFKRYEALRRFSKTLLLIKELDRLAQLIVYRLVKTLKVKFAGIYLYDKKTNVYALKAYRPLVNKIDPQESFLAMDDQLIRLLLIWRKELIQEEVENLPTNRMMTKDGGMQSISLSQVKNRMKQISATLIIPHFIEGELLGFLVLGDKEIKAIYTEEDISILSALSNSAALAIENALFLIDLKITQAELFNAKRIAELGYMASAMGHEINNRLQAIYNAGFDMSDNPIVADLIRTNPQAREVFDKDIKHINDNIDDATAIINELKTYARPQNSAQQNLVPLNLADAIDKALKVVRLQAVNAFDSVDVEITIPENLPKVLGNFIQLQQVFVNILNNAHDAIIEKKNYFATHSEVKQAGYRGRIQLRITEVKNTLDIHVSDNGIGMTEEIKKRLFIPLYTSKASADRKALRGVQGGTGIGLYTIQTIIRGHNGAISVYETERLTGTDFLITLPAAKTKDLKKESVTA
ncbi:MAG: ATP-binding protein [Candidatus Omnitrophota bacterium]